MSDAASEAPSAAATAIPPAERALAALGRVFGEGVFTTSTFRDNTRVHVGADRLVELLRTLKDECGFAMLAELGCVDYLGYPGRSPSRDRFEVHYILLDLDTSDRIVVKVGVAESEATLPSVVPLWMGANWMEREIFDLYGIAFDGHPDLRRILMPEGFAAHPLRKDYPLRGRGERHNFPRLNRDES